MVVILIKQIVVMLAMMSVGVVLYKIKAVDETGVAQLSNIALYVATPCVVLRALRCSVRGRVRQCCTVRVARPSSPALRGR